MVKKFQDATYGEIVCEEGFLGNVKSIIVNGVPATKVNKTSFVFVHEDEQVNITIKMNDKKGVDLCIGEKTYQVKEPRKWYEMILAWVPLVFIIVWGNSPSAVKLFPVVGGAIGGAIAGLFACISLAVMSRVNKGWQKVLVGLGCFVLAILVCYLVAVVILASV